MKWVVAAGGVGLVGFALWQFFAEYVRSGRREHLARQPWDAL